MTEIIEKNDLISDKANSLLSDKAIADYQGLAKAIEATAKKCIKALQWLDSNSDMSLEEKEVISDEIGSLIILCSDFNKIGISHEELGLPISLPDKTQMYSGLTDARNYCEILMHGKDGKANLESSLALALTVNSKPFGN